MENKACGAGPLFVIPARGGSKGIPGKNIADLDGKPLIAYTIEAARRALDALGLTEPAPGGTAPRRLIVSTDSAEIAAVAEACGASVPFLRPVELSTDRAGSREVVLHAMDYADKAGIPYGCVVLLQPTSPFRQACHVLRALELYRPGETDMVVSVCETSANPYYNCFETDSRGYLHVSKGDGLLTRRQDAPPAWEYNGAVYVIDPESLRRMPLGAFPRRVPYVMGREDSVDIDSPLDLTIARTLMRARRTN